jgi:lipopolysaccharide export system permease protein
MQFIWKYVDDLVGKGLDWYIIVELVVYTAASLVPHALPLAVLLSSIMTFGKMGEEYELVAFKSAGVSLFRLMRPLIIMTFLIGLGGFFFFNEVIPVANLKSGSLLWDIRNQKPSVMLREGIFYTGIEGFSIKIGGKSGEDGEILEDVMIYDHSDNRGNTKVIKARSGRMEVLEKENLMILYLFDGHSYEDLRPRNKKDRFRYPFMRTEFKEEIIRFDISRFQLRRTDEELFKDNYRMKRIQALSKDIDSLNINYDLTIEEFSRRVSAGMKMDTVNYTVDVPKGDFLSMYKESDQKLVINRALQAARNMNSYVDSHINEYQRKKEWIARHEIEIQKKFSLAFLTFLLFFVGAPLGAIIRKGGMGMPVVVAILIFLFYHVSNTITEKLARDLALTPFWGMWVANMVLFPAGIWLTYKSSTDSRLFDIDHYLEPLRRVFGHLFRKKKE